MFQRKKTSRAIDLACVLRYRDDDTVRDRLSNVKAKGEDEVDRTRESLLTLEEHVKIF